MKKFLSVVLAVAMVLASVSAVADAYVIADPITTAAAPAGGGEVDTVRYAGTEGKDYTDEAFYTYNSYTSALTSSMNWDPLSWETSDDSDLMDYQVSGFYTFMMNEDLTGYSVVPVMASDYAQDVTAEYVGKFGVAEGETGKAWRIALRQGAMFNDGTLITADDYIYSMQQQLNPKILNRRADSYYDGDFSIVNAKNYLYSGSTAYALVDGTEAEDEALYLDMNFWGIVGASDADGNACPTYVSITDEVLYRDEAVEDETDAEAWVSAKYIFDTYLAEGAPYADYYYSYIYKLQSFGTTSWDQVGLVKVDDYTIDFILEAPITDPSFNIPYYLSSNFLVEKSVYEACKKFYAEDGSEVDNEADAATVTTTYCKSLENNVSYGPYVLTSFELDKEYVLSRNENWIGYQDGLMSGLYQTDAIKVSVIAEHTTAMLSFEKGEIDEVSLQSEDMDKYASSAYIQYTPNTYTTKLTFNTDEAKLTEHGTGSQVLVNKAFREAFAYAFDRHAFTTAYTASHVPGYGMLNTLYCYDPFTGASYRESDAAKAALCHVYGMTYGEGGDYDTLDEAYDAITAYDTAKATALLQQAYDECVAAGLYDGTSNITINFRVYTSDTIYVQMFTFFDTALQQAAVGTGFEGKISLEMTVDADYYDTMYSGGADIIFSTWGGSQMSPFGMLYQCYCDAADKEDCNQMEYGFHTESYDVTFTVDGTEYTASLHDWANWMNNATVEGISDVIGNFADFDNATKCAFFAGCEEAYLASYTCTPVYYRNVASLYSQKINYVSDTYVPLMGYGGIDTLTYNYSDADWTEYITNNTLQY